MKAQLLPTIILVIGIVAIGLAILAQDRPSRSEMIFACKQATGTIPELIEAAPYGAGRVNRTKAWFENMFGIIGEVSSSIFNTQKKSELSKVGKAVIRLDLSHTSLHIALTTIIYADFESVEELMPSKLLPPADYINEITALKEAFIDPKCWGFVGLRT